MTGETAGDPTPLEYGVDLRVGQAYQLGSHTVGEQELMDFALAWDPQGFHTDKAQAEAGAYGGLIASGVHTIAIYQRLSIQSAYCNWSVIAGRSFRDLCFLRPVRPGDTLTGTVVVEDIVFDAQNRALVTTAAELVNQHAKPVLSLFVDAYIRARPSQ